MVRALDIELPSENITIKLPLEDSDSDIATDAVISYWL